MAVRKNPLVGLGTQTISSSARPSKDSSLPTFNRLMLLGKRIEMEDLFGGERDVVDLPFLNLCWIAIEAASRT